MAITKNQVKKFEKKSDKKEPNKEFEAFFKHYSKRENMLDLYDQLMRVYGMSNISVIHNDSSEWKLGYVNGMFNGIFSKITR